MEIFFYFTNHHGPLADTRGVSLQGYSSHNDFTGFTVTGTYKKRADSKPALIITFDILTLMFHYQWIYQYLVYITQIETNQIMTGAQMLCLNIK